MRDDDVDDLLRTAMKTLDDQMPPGYFEDLPNQALARLEDSSMQTSGTGHSDDVSTGAPPVKKRDEDSGLHDIRELASSQRMRLTKRTSTAPPVDEELLASSSGGWKAAVALPEPARMVSLPELSELPTKAEVEVAAVPVAKADRKSRKSGELKAAQSAAVAKIEAPVLEQSKPAAVTPIGARVAQSHAKKSNKGMLLGIAGLGLAAAAGVAVYVTTQTDNKTASKSTPAAEDRAPSVAANSTVEPAATGRAAAQPTVTAIEPPADQKADEPGTEGKASEAPMVAPEPPKAAKQPPTKAKPERTGGKGKQVIEVPGPEKEPVKKPDVKAEKPVKKDGEPDFDQLLKEAGEDKKVENKPKLERTALSVPDFKKGMAAVQGRAMACYKGTQGQAAVKLTIAPSGTVAKVTVTGVGAAEASCIEAAVKGATFPPWDGGPQSQGYSYLLSE